VLLNYKDRQLPLALGGAGLHKVASLKTLVTALSERMIQSGWVGNIIITAFSPGQIIIQSYY